MGGTAKALYEQGIAISMQQWGITDNTAIQDYINSTDKPAALNDYLNSPAVSDVSIRFASDPATQLEQILTQKWIALYPDGIEAWSEIRRTGYPKLYPVISSDNPDIVPPGIIRRVPFISFEYQTNREAVNAAIPLLNGPDKANTNVWWDVH
jgi:hypothetical protein